MHPYNMLFDEILVGRFFNLKTRHDVASFFGINELELERMLYKGNFSRNYKTFLIKKKNGKLRKIDAPNKWIKLLQKRLHEVMAMIYMPKSSASAYIGERGVIYNAKHHVKKKYVLNLDLKDFFPSINFGRVRGMFMSFPFELPVNVSSILAQLCCYNKQLPQGAPSSPIVSNIICSKMDTELFHLARKRGCDYTRYADDITISTNSDRFPEEIATIEWNNNKISLSLGTSLVSIITNNGFIINEEKTNMRKKGARQVVTGIVVNEKVNVRRDFIKSIRGALNAFEKFGEGADDYYLKHIAKRSRARHKQEDSLANYLNGRVGYVKLVRGAYDPVFKKLRHRLDTCLGKKSFLFKNKEEEIFAGLWVLEYDCGEDCGQGTAFMVEGIGLVTCQHVLGSNPYVYRYNDLANTIPVKIKTENEDLDLAILTLQGDRDDNYYGFSLATNADNTIGQKVIWAGFPQFAPGAEPTVINTEITSKKKEHGVAKLQIGARVVSGNSGGPLFDENLKIIGIADKGREDNLCTAIDVSELKRLL